MDLPKRIMLPCGNAAELDQRTSEYYCNFCWKVVGSKDESEECKRKREEAQQFKNDYWMDINNDPNNT